MTGNGRPRLLDLFCGAGGAGMGYHRAGFDVTGVDVAPQPRYPFAFVQADALAYVREHGAEYDAIHASPPCQAYSVATTDPSRHPDLYGPTRDALVAAGRPWAIENVIGAPSDAGVVLCGTQFGLSADGEWIRRHRNFEASVLMWQPQCRHPASPRPLTVTGNAFLTVTRDVARGRGTWGRQGTWDVTKRAMGIEWMNRRELVQAIPPAYTEWVGRQLRAIL